MLLNPSMAHQHVEQYDWPNDFPIKKFWFNCDGMSVRVTIVTKILVNKLILYMRMFLCPLWLNIMTTNVRIID
jgi:hypothetical protein